MSPLKKIVSLIPSTVISLCFASYVNAATALESEWCVTPLAADEPLCNPHLSTSPWSVSHMGSYAQASSSHAAPQSDQNIIAQHIYVDGQPIGLPFTGEYNDGGRALWVSTLSFERPVIKVDHDTFEVIDTYVPSDREQNPPQSSGGITGSYSLIDRDNHFIVGREKEIEIYADAIKGDRFSSIELKKRFKLPDEFFCRTDDVLVGLVMTYDGRIAFATEQGSIGTLPRQPNMMRAENLRFTSINGEACGDPTVASEDLEIISNSISTDETGGIFVVSSEAMYRIDSHDSMLSPSWRAEYQAGDGNVSAIRLGPGAGSTPTLMGEAHDDDRFVAIHDGQELMNLVLFWRDQIPTDWQGLPGKDRRIACEVPVTYGNDNATKTLSEQSISVRGYSAILVNNLLTDQAEKLLDVIPDPTIKSLFGALFSGIPAFAPKGVERIDWDPKTQTCNTVWANSEVSWPNMIPALSTASNLIYGIEQQEGNWGLGGLNFDTGESTLFKQASERFCNAGELLETAKGQPAVKLLLSTVLIFFPKSCENSVFSGATVGPDGAIYSGTFQGMSKYSPDVAIATPALDQAQAGINQGLELLSRTNAAFPHEPIAAKHWLQRGTIQLKATLIALKQAKKDHTIDQSTRKAARKKIRKAKAAFNKAQKLLSKRKLQISPIEKQLHQAKSHLISAKLILENLRSH